MIIIKDIVKISFLSLLIISLFVVSCSEEDPMPVPITTPDIEPDQGTGTDNDGAKVEVNITNLLTNQVDEVIIPTYEDYQNKMNAFLLAMQNFADNIGDSGLVALKDAYSEAYLAFQAAAVHNYYATANADFINTTNLYPIEVDLLEEFIENEAFNFNASAQQRATGFPAIDYLLYDSGDVVPFFNEPKTMNFLLELVVAMKEKADLLVEKWTGSLRDNFIGNGGVGLGSSVSVQLNRSMVYYEDHIRGNKVGIPIGRLGPNDTPIPADPTKIEGYYQSLIDGRDTKALALIKAAVEEMEDIYLGTTPSGVEGIGYEDLLISIDQESLNNDIKAQFQEIYDQINNRTHISGNEDLYNSIQELVTLYKSDLFPVLNVQDADGANDGD